MRLFNGFGEQGLEYLMDSDNKRKDYLMDLDNKDKTI